MVFIQLTEFGNEDRNKGNIQFKKLYQIIFRKTKGENNGRKQRI